MRRNFWQGWEEAGAFGWLIGCFFGGGGDQTGDPVLVPAKHSLGPNSPQASRTGDKQPWN